MFINTTVVQALMALRGIDETTLATIAFVAPKRLREWLAGDGDGDEQIAFERQLEVLRTLGIQNEAPRGDVVHHWHVREPLFGSTRRIYWALRAIVEAFGGAQVVFLSKEADPALTFRNEARFVLKFETFRALLHIEGHPMRSLRFHPDAFPGLQWMPGSYGVLLETPEYEALAPGLVEPKVLEGHLHAGADAFHWERLTHLAREANVSTEQLLTWVTNAQTPQLPIQPTPPAVELPATTPVATSPAAVAAPELTTPTPESSAPSVRRRYRTTSREELARATGAAGDLSAQKARSVHLEQLASARRRRRLEARAKLQNAQDDAAPATATES